MVQRATKQASSPIGQASPKLPSLKLLTKHFEFLDRLRESGVTNMFGASPYLEQAFDMKTRTGAPILSAWMKTFSDEPASDRAQKAREAA